MLAAGWSVTIWFLQYLWENVQSVLEGYYIYVLAYFVLAAVISWAVCYYKGPPTNPRALNLIKWSIQLVGLVLLYHSTQIPEVSVTIIVLVLLKAMVRFRFSIYCPQTLRTLWWVGVVTYWLHVVN